MSQSPPLGTPFWRFWSAASLANIGDGIRVAAFPLLALSLTGDPLGLAVVATAQTLPWLVAGLAAGALADRVAPRTLLAAADTVRALMLVLLVATVATGTATIALVAACAFGLGVGEAVRDTAGQVAVPKLVPPAALERANGRLTAGTIVGNEFVGPPVGAALFVVGAAVPFAANGASLALAVMLVLSLPLSLARTTTAMAAATTTVTTVGPSIRAGLRWLTRHRTLRALALVVAAVAAADAAWFAIFLLYARDVLGVGALGYGLLLSAGAGGGLAGAFLADRLVAGRRHRLVLAVSLAVTAGVPALLLAVPQIWVAVVVTVVSSGAFAVLNICAATLRQRTVPDGLLGRVTAASKTLIYGAAGGGALLGGALAAGVGLAAPFGFAALVAVVAATGWWLATRGDVPSARPA
ncbi:MFS transporter [Solwaraspora sp. WMMD406]|uniref:MFS transporter n=1 Tax=Solwaraspora sp. WMMD406 TaxID=3016095 RepID=UPI002416F644|nr:MFS transporter [Solwaraspora sp. WMMD406]MDG4766327.1 MFS transporter [Solwaraspora sp. WMMD406]